ncbi:MAG TPA: DNA repair protein RecO [Gammaproteobacteria bacterium]|nr:DNA repair protein RecO [Gammaproteobacteria bacterium]
MRIQLTPGFVLHERPYRDTSALLELFTREHGRVGVVARGLRTRRSRLRGELQPFCPLLLSWQARGELGTLTGAERRPSAALAPGDALFSGWYLNELLLRLLARNDPHPDLFDAYAGAVAALAAAEAPAPVLRRFEAGLLQALGYGLVFDHDVESGEPVRPDCDYDYRLESGPVRVSPGQAGGFVFSGARLLAMAGGRFEDAAVEKDARRLMRAALRLYLGDKPLKTREVLESLRG